MKANPKLAMLDLCERQARARNLRGLPAPYLLRKAMSFVREEGPREEQREERTHKKGLAIHARSGILRRKPVHWVGSSLKDLRQCPEDVKDEIGHALDWAQRGTHHPQAKPLKGFGDRGILEIIANDSSGTYRAVYTVRFERAVYVLHVFQKKSKHGIETPPRDLELVRSRLKAAQLDYEEQYP